MDQQGTTRVRGKGAQSSQGTVSKRAATASAAAAASPPSIQIERPPSVRTTRSSSRRSAATPDSAVSEISVDAFSLSSSSSQTVEQTPLTSVSMITHFDPSVNQQSIIAEIDAETSCDENLMVVATMVDGAKPGAAEIEAEEAKAPFFLQPSASSSSSASLTTMSSSSPQNTSVNFEAIKKFPSSSQPAPINYSAAAALSDQETAEIVDGPSDIPLRYRLRQEENAPDIARSEHHCRLITEEEYVKQGQETTKSELLKLVQYLAGRNASLSEATPAPDWARWLVLAFIFTVGVLLFAYRPYCDAETQPKVAVQQAETVTQQNATQADLFTTVVRSLQCAKKSVNSWWDVAAQAMPCKRCPEGMRCSRLSVIGCKNAGEQLLGTDSQPRLCAPDQATYLAALDIKEKLDRRAFEYYCLASVPQPSLDVKELGTTVNVTTVLSFAERYSSVLQIQRLGNNNLYSHRFEGTFSCVSGIKYQREVVSAWISKHSGPVQAFLLNARSRLAHWVPALADYIEPSSV